MIVSSIGVHSATKNHTCSFCEHENKTMLKNTRENKSKGNGYFVGATLIAASVIAGIIIHKGTNSSSLRSVEDATKYFKKKFNVDADFKECKDMEFINAINNVLKKAKQMNCKMPTSINFCSFKENSIKKAFIAKGIEPVSVHSNAYGYAGEGGHMFLNTEAPEIKNLISTINHRGLEHFDTKTPSNLAVKEYIVAHELGHINGRTTILNRGYKSVFGELPDEVADNILNNLQKHLCEMYKNVKPMKESPPEVVPEIFAKLILNSKRNFDDKSMLLYDIMGGGEIPNLKIKDKKYPEYMQDLYKRSKNIFN